MKKYQLIVFAILLLAGFLRLFRIFDLTEFLGDQGRTGIDIYQAFQSRSLPLVGPTVITGYYLGPFFYYLMGFSFILFNFNPVMPAVFIALLGVTTVFLIYCLCKKLFGVWIAIGISAIYATSPIIAAHERTIWEPTVIPFFILLFLFSLFKVFEKRNFGYFLLSGFSIGALVQLHYPNMFFIFLAFIFWIYIFFQKKYIKSKKNFFLWTLLGIMSFIGALLPFLIYELNNNFIDLKGVFLNFASSGQNPAVLSPFRIRAADMITRTFTNIFPFTNQTIIIALVISFLIVPVLKKRTFWNLFFTLWFVLGIFIMSLYKGVVFNHYLNFLLPVPLFLLGFFVKSFDNKIIKKILIVVFLIIMGNNLFLTDIFKKGNRDLEITDTMTNRMIKEANNKPFSFTLISSRSFSDLHYRYFFLLKNATPEKITNNNYETLFLICEKETCPKSKDISALGYVDSMCFDKNCQGVYPRLELSNFDFDTEERILHGVLFVYKRK